MNSNKKAETFFSQLRQLAGTVEKQVARYQVGIQEKDRDFCAPQVIKKLTDLKNDVKQQTKSIQLDLSKSKENTRTLEQILSIGEAFLASQQEYISKTEGHLKQYGFVTLDETEESKKKIKKEETKNAEEPEENEADNLPCSPPAGQVIPAAVATNLNRTPRLEDAGISQMTLQYLNSIAKNKPTYRVAPYVPDIPSPFQHNGIICTPSLMGSKDMSMCGETLHAALASPVAPVLQDPGIRQIQDNMNDLPNPAGRLQFDNPQMNSPAAPVFRTPGMKQILSTVKDVGHGSTIQNKRPVQVGLFQSGASDGTRTHIQPKLEQKQAAFSMQKYAVTEPQEPEMTYSLEEMAEMTGMFSFNPVKKMPSAPQSLAFCNDNKENATPPEPEMLLERISKTNNVNDTSSGDAKPNIQKKTLYGDLPASPKFLGSYDFMRKSKFP